jgi:predicted ferric reductase
MRISSQSPQLGSIVSRRARSWRRPPLRLPRHVLARLLASPVAAGGGAAIWLWWSGTPAGALQTPGDAMMAAARITGLLAAYLLLVQVALMARIPWLERRIGADWLARAHRDLGIYLIIVLVAHAALMVGALALLDRLGFVDELAVVLTYPQVLKATGALALLLVVGLLSVRAVRRRLAYEAWHLTHLCAYPAVALAFFHQVAAGADLRGQPARTVWTGMHLAVLACLLRYRVWRPVGLALRHRLRVHAVVPESDQVVSIYISGRQLDRLGARAGQFFRWRFLTRDTWWQAHPFSLSAAPGRELLRLTVKALGDHSNALQRLRPGVRVVAEGPYGALTEVQRTRRRVLLIGGGIGITPLRALLASLTGAPGDIAFVYRGESAASMVFAKELGELAARRGVVMHALLGPRAPREPLSARRLRALVPDVEQRDVYVCGSPGMMETARRALRGAGVPRRRIHIESFDL